MRRPPISWRRRSGPGRCAALGSQRPLARPLSPTWSGGWRKIAPGRRPWAPPSRRPRFDHERDSAAAGTRQCPPAPWRTTPQQQVVVQARLYRDRAGAARRNSMFRATIRRLCSSISRTTALTAPISLSLSLSGRRVADLRPNWSGGGSSWWTQVTGTARAAGGIRPVPDRGGSCSAHRSTPAPGAFPRPVPAASAQRVANPGAGRPTAAHCGNPAAAAPSRLSRYSHAGSRRRDGGRPQSRGLKGKPIDGALLNHSTPVPPADRARPAGPRPSSISGQIRPVRNR